VIDTSWQNNQIIGLDFDPHPFGISRVTNVKEPTTFPNPSNFFILNRNRFASTVSKSIKLDRNLVKVLLKETFDVALIGITQTAF